MLLSHDKELIKGEIKEVIEDYTDNETGCGYQVLEMKDTDIEVEDNDGNILVPYRYKLGMGFISHWIMKKVS